MQATVHSARATAASTERSGELHVISRIREFDRIFLYVVAGLALVGLIGFGVYSVVGGSSSPKHISAVGIDSSGTVAPAGSATPLPTGQAITTLPAVPMPSFGSTGAGSKAPSSARRDPPATTSSPTTAPSRPGRRPEAPTSRRHTSVTTTPETPTTKKAGLDPARLKDTRTPGPVISALPTTTPTKPPATHAKSTGLTRTQFAATTPTSSKPAVPVVGHVSSTSPSAPVTTGATATTARGGKARVTTRGRRAPTSTTHPDRTTTTHHVRTRDDRGAGGPACAPFDHGHDAHLGAGNPGWDDHNIVANDDSAAGHHGPSEPDNRQSGHVNDQANDDNDAPGQLHYDDSRRRPAGQCRRDEDVHPGR